MPSRQLVVVTAGLGQPSATRLLADRLATGAGRALGELGTTSAIEVIELREHAQDLSNNLLTGFPSPRLRAAIDTAVGADGIIAVSPIFNASYSGLFKVFWDVVERDGLAGMPVLIGATGGTARHSLALDYAFRPLFAYLGASVVPTAVFAAAEDWGEGGAQPDGGLVDRIERAAHELAGAVTVRGTPDRVDPFADPVPFDQLLASRDDPA